MGINRQKVIYMYMATGESEGRRTGHNHESGRRSEETAGRGKRDAGCKMRKHDVTGGNIRDMGKGMSTTEERVCERRVPTSYGQLTGGIQCGI